MGATQIVKFLHEQKEASMAEVGKAFSQAGKRAIDIICENGHLELLKYFLPIHRAGLDIFEE